MKQGKPLPQFVNFALKNFDVTAEELKQHEWMFLLTSKGPFLQCIERENGKMKKVRVLAPRGMA